MTTLHEETISAQLATDYFKQFWDCIPFQKSDHVIEITTRQSFGKKTVTGLQVSLVGIEKCEGYSTKNMCMSVPCVRVPFSQALPQSRKNFKTVLKSSCEAWLTSQKTIDDNNHPYIVAIKNYLSKI